MHISVTNTHVVHYVYEYEILRRILTILQGQKACMMMSQVSLTMTKKLFVPGIRDS